MMQQQPQACAPQRPERLLPDDFWMFSYKVSTCRGVGEQKLCEATLLRVSQVVTPRPPQLASPQKYGTRYNRLFPAQRKRTAHADAATTHMRARNSSNNNPEGDCRSAAFNRGIVWPHRHHCCCCCCERQPWSPTSHTGFHRSCRCRCMLQAASFQREGLVEL